MIVAYDGGKLREMLMDVADALDEALAEIGQLREENDGLKKGEREMTTSINALVDENKRLRKLVHDLNNSDGWPDFYKVEQYGLDPRELGIEDC